MHKNKNQRNKRMLRNKNNINQRKNSLNQKKNSLNQKKISLNLRKININLKKRDQLRILQTQPLIQQISNSSALNPKLSNDANLAYNNQTEEQMTKNKFPSKRMHLKLMIFQVSS